MHEDSFAYDPTQHTAPSTGTRSPVIAPCSHSPHTRENARNTWQRIGTTTRVPVPATCSHSKHEETNRHRIWMHVDSLTCVPNVLPLTTLSLSGDMQKETRDLDARGLAFPCSHHAPTQNTPPSSPDWRNDTGSAREWAGLVGCTSATTAGRSPHAHAVQALLARLHVPGMGGGHDPADFKAMSDSA
jgi:hypothetical protein